jgi:hypothetical protein
VKAKINALKLSSLAIIATVLTLSSFTALPALAVTNSGARSITVTMNAPHGYSCNSPIVVSGTVTGASRLHKKVTVTLTADDVAGHPVYASGTAKIHGGHYSITLSIASDTLQETTLTATASYMGASASTDSNAYWSC